MFYGKYYLLFFISCSPFCLLGQKAVGIGTSNPRVTLEVAGDAITRDGIEIGVIDDMVDADTSTFLVQEDASNKLKTLDVSNPTGTALGYIQEYIIENPNEDWVLNLDTNISATEFVVNTISAYYNRELDIDGYATVPNFSAYIQDGTWRLTADFPSANNLYDNEIGTWTITTLIYSRDLSKQLGTITIPMNNGSEGSHANPIID
ncbi:hypothetical protein [Leeuwenhoekiella blandensis]|uniref:Uncharacterized protein n=1 Tax=Leeuwenhoekiella blandensis (strain CECT 7118 / CCUG 51940 / KCTC 22103 / MED217) TaxID=398720 RepID=A3XNW8_LEEBM|nr:hypothetical protein [Leeuwenhoekiella blandensis]EAQ48760.1 hypothetical protein MED217_09435 [Leeuwenhoekiella blandensis MED217]